jgi:hypothetical protein
VQCKGFYCTSIALLVQYDWQLLEGNWPILDRANLNPHILKRIKMEANGSAITTYNDFLSLGEFFINTDLLVQHPI